MPLGPFPTGLLRLRRPDFEAIRKGVWSPESSHRPAVSGTVPDGRSREMDRLDGTAGHRMGRRDRLRRHEPRRIRRPGVRRRPPQVDGPPRLLVARDDGPLTSLVTQMTLGPRRFEDPARPVMARILASSRATKAARPTRASIRFVIASATQSMTTPPSHSTRPGNTSSKSRGTSRVVLLSGRRARRASIRAPISGRSSRPSRSRLTSIRDPARPPGTLHSDSCEPPRFQDRVRPGVRPFLEVRAAWPSPSPSRIGSRRGGLSSRVCVQLETNWPDVRIVGANSRLRSRAIRAIECPIVSRGCQPVRPVVAREQRRMSRPA